MESVFRNSSAVVSANLTYNKRLVWLEIVPGICIPIAIINLAYVILLTVIYVKIKFWKSPVLSAYFNLLMIDIISSIGCIILYSFKLWLRDPSHTYSGVSTEAFYSIEIFAFNANTLSTIVLVTIRLIALAAPFTFRHAVTTRRVFLALVLAWILAVLLSVADVYIWDTIFNSEDYLFEPRMVYWSVFIAIISISLCLALSSLIPLNVARGSGYRTATNSIVILAVVNFICYGGFGVFNLLTVKYCSTGWYPIWVLQLFCNPETYLSITFIFPILNSLSNCIVVSRGGRVKEELGAMWEHLFKRRSHDQQPQTVLVNRLQDDPAGLMSTQGTTVDMEDSGDSKDVVN